MAEEQKTIMVEGVECIQFPIPKYTQDDPLDDAKWFLDCLYHRLFFLNQNDQQRSRELSLAITNLQQAGFWLDVHVNKRKFLPPIHGAKSQ